ncbi:MAG TPA: hypothetical protein VLL04_04795, partial [Rhizomicrobium sp.]|nr:hypothetical protein [Rhizomicrobium sp.]
SQAHSQWPDCLTEGSRGVKSDQSLAKAGADKAKEKKHKATFAIKEFCIFGLLKMNWRPMRALGIDNGIVLCKV